MATAVVLFALKLVAWFMTGSVSLLASLIDSLMDVMASGINFVAVRWSLAPPDEEHRFGHGKAESLAGLGQAAFIGGSALFLSFQAVDRLLNPVPLERLDVAVWVMVFSIAATGGLVLLQRYVIRRTESLAIRADSLHYVSDLLTNLGILAALGLALAGWGWADAVFGLAVAAYIMWSAARIGVDAVHMLMDRELPEEEQRRIMEIARGHGEVAGAHDLRTRQAGHVRFIQLHLELRPDMPLLRAHAVADRVAADIRAVFPGADVMIHQDPAGLPEANREPWRDESA
ncbi:MAG: cation diffusion facilitator family transporter [Gammaproteobacteria bacterium]